MFEFCSTAADYSPGSEAKAVSLWPAWISFMSWQFLCFSLARMLKLVVPSLTGELLYCSLHSTSFYHKNRRKQKR